MRAFHDCRLYGIVDLGYVKPDAVLSMTRALVEGGVDILQLRAKNLTPQAVEAMGRQMHLITRDVGVPFVINDHPNVAASIGSEGVHIGQDDGALADTRAVVGPSCFVGRSTHSVTQARLAMAEGADYIGFGPLYATGTKPDYKPIGLDDIAEVHRLASVPVFCIGGVNLETLPDVLSAGAQRVVMVSALLLAPDIRAYIRSIKELLGV